MKKILVIILTITMLANMGVAQSLKVTILNPRPNINIDPSTQTIALSLGKQITDEFRIDSGSGLKKTDVTGWLQSLKNGFNNAFSDSYKVVEDKSTADIVLTITRAEPIIAFGTYTKTLSASVSSSSVLAHLTYSANLEYKDNKLIHRTAGTINSKKEILRPKEANAVFQDAIETMYEAMIPELLKKQ